MFLCTSQSKLDILHILCVYVCVGLLNLQLTEQDPAPVGSDTQGSTCTYWYSIDVWKILT